MQIELGKITAFLFNFIMTRKQSKQTWTPATEYKVTKLPSRGPKPGQSTESYLRGKDMQDKRIKRQANAKGFILNEDFES